MPKNPCPNVTDLYQDPFKVLVTLGESTTAGGWSSNRERCWASILAALISDFQDEPVKLINSGIGANLVSTRSPNYEISGKPAANERIQKHVIDHHPDLLIISYGINDARGGTPIELFRQELTRLVKEIRKGCSPLVLLLGPYFIVGFQDYGPEWGHADSDMLEVYNTVTAQVAHDQDCLFCDVYHTYGGAPWLVHYDGVHANDLGHRVVANAIFQVLAQRCSGLALRTKGLEQTSERWRDESVLQADYGYYRPDSAPWKNKPQSKRN